MKFKAVTKNLYSAFFDNCNFISLTFIIFFVLINFDTFKQIDLWEFICFNNHDQLKQH